MPSTLYNEFGRNIFGFRDLGFKSNYLPLSYRLLFAFYVEYSPQGTSLQVESPWPGFTRYRLLIQSSWVQIQLTTPPWTVLSKFPPTTTRSNICIQTLSRFYGVATQKTRKNNKTQETLNRIKDFLCEFVDERKKLNVLLCFFLYSTMI
jgi:hypothetical protein